MDENPYSAPQDETNREPRPLAWYDLSRFDDPDSDLPSTKSALIVAALAFLGGALTAYFGTLGLR
jgi:hypothetical protein